MRINTISATYSRKFNLGDYEALELSETTWANLDEEDDPDHCLDELMRMAKMSVFRTASPILKNNLFQIQKHNLHTNDKPSRNNH